ncbi:hypothetical protein B5E77_06525 [Lachnoclostridium sp. An131]|uniref:hypothetical protein n=1 Tax=Lachnoclostridium sp. An131 TaxID=1965555 RepID=UPI000B36D87B|nr:hypothetical protein [Lachnoclostridium sp. An131]OUQ27617.1 hypothetical protein B5E77_06525 [Lachnoclostridium sp. An131]
MSLINKEIGEFTVQAYHEGAFKTVSKADVLGKRIVQTGKSGEVLSSEMRREFFAGVGVPRAHCPLYTDVNIEI